VAASGFTNAERDHVKPVGIVAAVRVLVTGISGFVGRHLANELISHGHEVVGVDIARPVTPLPEQITLITADLLDVDAARRAVARVRPDAIIHLAGAASVGQSFADPLATWRLNLDGTLSVLEAVRQEAPEARCITALSGEAYGLVDPAELPVTETTVMRPHSPYGASKAAADLASAQYRDGYGVDVVRVRSFNGIGPGQDARFVVPAVAHQIAVGERDGVESIAIAVGNVDSRRDFTDVRDLVRAYRLLAEHPKPQGVYVVCSGRSHAVRELIDGLAALASSPVTVTSDPTRRRDGEAPDLYGSPDRLTADTGWVPEIALETSLADTLDWWRARVAEED
jgi:GDP-4-dehydro-6-deoxy-D-mannose reductase